MATPLFSRMLLGLALSGSAYAGPGDRTVDSAVNPEPSDLTVVDNTPYAWLPTTGTELTEGWAYLACGQEDLLETLPGWTWGESAVAPIDLSNWTVSDTWTTADVCEQHVNGMVYCPIYLTPGLWVFQCRAITEDSHIDINPWNDVVQEILWVSPAD